MTPSPSEILWGVGCKIALEFSPALVGVVLVALLVPCLTFWLDAHRRRNRRLWTFRRVFRR